jgi:hypothetical protein
MDGITRSCHRNKQVHRGELICPTGVHAYMHKLAWQLNMRADRDFVDYGAS